MADCADMPHKAWSRNTALSRESSDKTCLAVNSPVTQWVSGCDLAVSCPQGPTFCSLGTVNSVHCLAHKAVHLIFPPVILSWLLSTCLYHAVTKFINGVHILFSTPWSLPVAEISRNPGQASHFTAKEIRVQKDKGHAFIELRQNHHLPLAANPQLLLSHNLYNLTLASY